MTRKRKAPSCRGCEARCCRYIAVEIDKPTTKGAYDNLRWILLHDKTHVYIDHDGDWVLQVDVSCTKIDKKTHRCRIYSTRPGICEELTLEECEREGHDAIAAFYTPEDLDKWKSSRRRKRKK